MESNRNLFGTDGIRGVAGQSPLDTLTLVRLGMAVADLFIQERTGHHKILIGKDTRLSGYMIENALVAGITARGVNAEIVGPIPTPGVAYLTRSMRADAGIMISASHNPYEDNGIKIFNRAGEKLEDAKESQLEELMCKPLSELTAVEPACIGKAHRLDDATGRYTVYLKEGFPQSLTLEGMRVGFDCANGAAYHVAPQTLTELGADVVSRGISPNGRNINAGFGSLYPEIVRELVLEQNLAVGISLDGDADRALFVDEKGVVLDGDMVLAICAVDLKRRGLLTNNTVVGTVMSNLGLDRFLEKEGIKLERAAVGDRYVREKMVATGAILGGEQSGHTLFLDQSTTGDGVLTTLKVLELMRRYDCPLSELHKDFQHFPQKLVNLKVSSKPPLETIQGFDSLLSDKEKALEGKGRILVRYSGTESKVRVMVESDDEADCQRHADDIIELLEREIGGL